MGVTVMEDLIISSLLSTSVQRQKQIVPSECKVCGTFAQYSFYGAITCHSCKMFFKRNAVNGQEILKCHFDNDCDININNRHTCACCRLNKCFKSGMHIEMIRASRGKRNMTNKQRKLTADSILSTSTKSVTPNKKHTIEQITTFNLLESNQPTLTIDQWNLLSNLVHCFDENSGYSFVEHFIEEQNRLPLKFRFKYSSVTDFFISMTSKIQLVFEKYRDFLCLSHHDRTTMLRTTVEYTSSIGGMLILRQYKLFDYLSFYKSAEMIFQPSAMVFVKRVIDQFDSDDTFTKLILAILSFSTTNYTVYRKDTEINLPNIKVILPIQDMYTDLAWRYLLHKYGHQQAVIRFSNLLRCLFSAAKAIVEAHESQLFTEMIDSVIEQTEQTFGF